jgi:hypothetical protein
MTRPQLVRVAGVELGVLLEEGVPLGGLALVQLARFLEIPLGEGRHPRFREPLCLPEVIFGCLRGRWSTYDRGKVSDDPTIAVCFDADRLELARFGRTVDPRLLSADAAIQRVVSLVSEPLVTAVGA